MDAHLIDSQIFGRNWSTETSHQIFSEAARVQRWVDVVGALARAQARTGLIPESSADLISGLRATDLDFGEIARITRETSHSTLGLIRVMQEALPAAAQEHVYVGTTVQDITDTALSLELRAVGSVVWQDLRSIEGTLIELALQHRATPMSGRTHGQPGAPISFGFKVATWLDEIGRHIQRLDEMQDRVLVAQLGGGVGTLDFFGGSAIELRSLFAAELGLGTPAISWLTTRDRLAEFANLMAVITASLARIANEVYSLQRLEVSELKEASSPGTVGSITMPHKQNPESSEQVVALARLVRSQASVLVETMVQEHERDARGWKAEWALVPELCQYTAAAVHLSRQLVEGLEVNPARMQQNLASAGSLSSAEMLRILSGEIGKHRAQTLLNDAYRDALAGAGSVFDELPDELANAIRDQVDSVSLGASEAMVMRVVDTANQRRNTESTQWPSPR